ncbi:MAG: WYL domain-containing protein [Bifidobacteriaceae bacterium]|nr:WYL domain-containing protein [Bifidobacteriaceae bacterium]
MKGSTEAAERLVNLILALRETRRGLTRQQMMAVAGTDDDRMFERDKDMLRQQMGLELVVDGDPGSPAARYRIIKQNYGMPDIEFTAEEHTAIGLAVQAWQGADMAPVARMALTKLRALGVDAGHGHATDGLLVAQGPGGGPVEVLVRAVLDRQVVSFKYRTAKTGAVATRTVEPWAVRKPARGWYLAGLDRDRGEPRVFRLSRILGQVKRLGEPGAFDAPSREAVDQAFLMGRGSRQQAELRVTPAAGRILRAEGATGSDAALALPYTDQATVADRLASLAPGAVVLGPPDLVAAVRRRLSGALAAHQGKPSHRPVRLAPAQPPKTPRDRTTSAARAARMVAIVGYLDRVGTATIGELAARFDTSKDKIIADIHRLWTDVGLPGQAGGDLLDFAFSEDEKEVSLVDSQGLHVPVRLSRLEATTMAAALRALMANPALAESAGAASALAKLTGALGTPANPLEVELPAPAEPAVLAAIRAAITGGRGLEFGYVDGQGRASRRRVDPLWVFTDQDHWLLAAWDVAADAERYFRVDRISNPTSCDQYSSHPDVTVQQSGFSGRANYVVDVLFQAPARWRAEALTPVAGPAELTGGAIQVKLGIGQTDWIIQFALAAGGEAEVLAPPEIRTAIAERAAAALAAVDAPIPGADR